MVPRRTGRVPRKSDGDGPQSIARLSASTSPTESALVFEGIGQPDAATTTLNSLPLAATATCMIGTPLGLTQMVNNGNKDA